MLTQTTRNRPPRQLVVIAARLSAKHQGVGLEWVRRAGRLQLLTVIGEWIPDNKFPAANLSEEDAAVAAVIDRSSTAVAVPWLGPRGGCRGEEETREGPYGIEIVEEAEQRGTSVEGAVAAEEGRVGGDAEPELADDGGAEEVRWLVRRDAEEDLRGDVFFQLRRPALPPRHGEGRRGVGARAQRR
ncbi:unnamed protein product [Miscanthus lutarioriparius]|uniref:Uncharacterized protein n=1 Tax=Miscanthus lutarioriparius TaxID=422564 RepID=A0A811NGP9_9POAL|nr:unnamed protein product [Miscanthus lutarioriparius]